MGLKDPTIENYNDLEFKAIEKVESTDGCREIAKILSAFANTSGGVLVVGLGLDKRKSHLQSFPENTMAIQDVMTMVHGNTQPSAASYVDGKLDFVKLYNTRVLRFNIRRATEILAFKNPKSGALEAWHRVAGTTQLMTPAEVAARSRSLSDNREEPLSKFIRLDLPPAAKNPPRILAAPAQRIVMAVDPDIFWSFGPHMSPEAWNHAHFYALQSPFNCGSVESIVKTLRAANETTGLRLDDELCYSIKEDDRQLFSSGIKNLAEDLRDIEAVTRQMLGADWRRKLKGGLGDTEYRPIVVVQGSSRQGAFFMEFQYRSPGTGFDRPSVGFVFGDIPFDDAPFRTFFRTIGHAPDAYEQLAGVRTIGFMGSMRLRGASMRLFGDEDHSRERVNAGNPFFGHEKALLAEWGRTGFEWVAERVGKLERAIYYVGGGATPSDREFRLNRIDIMPMALLRDTLFTTAYCWAEDRT